MQTDQRVIANPYSKAAVANPYSSKTSARKKAPVANPYGAVPAAIDGSGKAKSGNPLEGERQVREEYAWRIRCEYYKDGNKWVFGVLYTFFCAQWVVGGGMS